jgi:hypothetical protein
MTRWCGRFARGHVTGGRRTLRVTGTLANFFQPEDHHGLDRWAAGYYDLHQVTSTDIL